MGWCAVIINCPHDQNQKIKNLSSTYPLGLDWNMTCLVSEQYDVPQWQKGFFPSLLTRGLPHLHIQILFLLFASFQISVKSVVQVTCTKIHPVDESADGESPCLLNRT